MWTTIELMIDVHMCTYCCCDNNVVFGVDNGGYKPCLGFRMRRVEIRERHVNTSKVILEYTIPTSVTIPTLTSVAVFCAFPTCISKMMIKKTKMRTRMRMLL